MTIAYKFLFLGSLLLTASCQVKSTYQLEGKISISNHDTASQRILIKIEAPDALKIEPSAEQVIKKQKLNQYGGLTCSDSACVFWTIYWNSEKEFNQRIPVTISCNTQKIDTVVEGSTWNSQAIDYYYLNGKLNKK